MSSDSHPSKKIKMAQAGTPIFSDLDLTQLCIDATPQGSAEIKYTAVKYGGVRLTFQLSDAATSLRAPFGLDDGSKFGGIHGSLNIEMPDAQLAFFRDGIEAAVKEAAVKNKEAWFGAIKPLPADDTVRDSFNSRVREDEAGKYTSTLKVNVRLGVDASKTVRVLTAQRLPNGKVTKPAPGAPTDVARGCRVVPVLRTAGGVWISVNAKKKTFEYGLVFEASDLLVVEEGEATSAFNVEVASSDEEADGNDASVGGQFDE